jgi:hypothetical protein
MPRELSDNDLMCAILNEEDIPVLCTLKEFTEWSPRNHERCLIKQDEINGWTIATTFQGMSFAQDGPPLFWTTMIWPAQWRCDQGSTGGNPIFSGTLEEALLWHESCVASAEYMGMDRGSFGEYTK